MRRKLTITIILAVHLSAFLPSTVMATPAMSMGTYATIPQAEIASFDGIAPFSNNPQMSEQAQILLLSIITAGGITFNTLEDFHNFTRAFEQFAPDVIQLLEEIVSDPANFIEVESTPDIEPFGGFYSIDAFGIAPFASPLAVGVFLRLGEHILEKAWGEFRPLLEAIGWIDDGIAIDNRFITIPSRGSDYEFLAGFYHGVPIILSTNDDRAAIDRRLITRYGASSAYISGNRYTLGSITTPTINGTRVAYRRIYRNGNLVNRHQAWDGRANSNSYIGLQFVQSDTITCIGFFITRSRRSNGTSTYVLNSSIKFNTVPGNFDYQWFGPNHFRRLEIGPISIGSINPVPEKITFEAEKAQYNIINQFNQMITIIQNISGSQNENIYLLFPDSLYDLLGRTIQDVVININIVHPPIPEPTPTPSPSPSPSPSPPPPPAQACCEEYPDCDCEENDYPPDNGNENDDSTFWSNLGNFFLSLFVPSENFFQTQFNQLETQLQARLPFQTFIDAIGRLREVSGRYDGDASVLNIDAAYNGRRIQVDIGNRILPHLRDIRAIVTGLYVIFLAYYNYRQIMFLIRGTNYQSMNGGGHR